MSRIRNFFSEFHPVVYMLLAGSIMVVMARAMSIPFLAIHLSVTKHLDPATIGLLLGAGSIAGTFGGFIGGTLSDRIGRKKVLIGTLFITSLVFLGFQYSTNTITFLLLNILLGLGSSFYDPVSKALMADLVPPEKRLRMFSLRYVTFNIGYALGPLLGSYLGLVQNNVAFLFTAAVYVAYAVLLLIFLSKIQLPETQAGNAGEKVTLRQSFNVMRKDVALRFLLIGGVLTMIVHGEMSVTLSQYLAGSFVDGVKMFAVLMSLNAVTTVGLQYSLSKVAEKWTPLKGIVIGSILFALGEIGFAIANGWAMFVVAMLVFTIAEIFLLPAEYMALDGITPEGMRGMYYGAQTFTNLGNFIGPWVGGILLSTYGGPTMFSTMAVIALLAVYFFWRARKISDRKAAVTDSVAV